MLWKAHHHMNGFMKAKIWSDTRGSLSQGVRRDLNLGKVYLASHRKS